VGHEAGALQTIRDLSEQFRCLVGPFSDRLLGATQVVGETEVSDWATEYCVCCDGRLRR
jgi:hypothetical protein